MHVLSVEQIEYLESLGYSDAVSISAQIWAFYPGDLSGGMPAPIPEAIANKVLEIKAPIISSKPRIGKSYFMPDDFLNIHKPRLMPWPMADLRSSQMKLGRKAGKRLIVFDRPTPSSPEEKTKTLNWIAVGYGVKSKGDRIVKKEESDA